MLKFIVLGLIQGFTEFLPVSSSGHLAIIQHFFGMNQDVVFITVLLHLGTVLSIFTFFFKEIWEALKSLKILSFVILVTIVTGIIAMVFKKTFESFFLSVGNIAIFLIINGLLLTLTKNIKKGEKDLSLKNTALMGFAQGLAITPGISRSGATITTLLLSGVKKETAFKFSFIASIPAILAAFILELKEIPAMTSFNPKYLTAGIITAYLSGLCALALLNKTVKSAKLHLFGYYCIVAGLALMFFLTR